uniref:t-SNARE coiled-coil homology domain-containing protein n=1 Tax=Bicosoecida sp. CB-2014 TaxID=1486930 RepID=A0A7S1C474_9STRA|mmetsp:Transcript_11543/g.40354  ORF Transcript_11543/g.40354 Transcript_11543/m.40354 type:complete len:280 (+) Transcript_11543:188-1027(+)
MADDAVATAEAIASRLKADLKRFGRQVDEVKAAGEEDKPELYEAAKASEKRLKKVIASFQREIGELPEDKRPKFSVKATKFEEQFKELRRALKFEAAATERGVLLDRGGRGGAGGESKGDRTTDSVLREAGTVASGTTDRLQRTLQVVNQTQEIGTATAAKMVEQTEQIGRVTTKVKKIDEDLRRADKLISRFMRRMYTDKVILAFIFLITVAIAGIIIYASINPDQDTFNVPEDATLDSDKLKRDAQKVSDSVSGRRLLRGDGAAAPFGLEGGFAVRG